MEAVWTTRDLTLQYGVTVDIGGAAVRLADGQAGPVRLVVTSIAAAQQAPCAAAAPAAAWPFKRKYRRPADCDDEMERRVLAVAARWSKLVCRITVLAQQRFSAIHARLVDGYSEAAIEPAMATYGRSEWHRANNAWLDLADWFSVKHLEQWIRKAGQGRQEAASQANRADMARPPADARVAGLTRDLGDAKRPRTEEQVLREAWFTLPAAERQRRLSAAVDDLIAAGAAGGVKLSAATYCQPVWRHVMARLRHEREQKGADHEAADGGCGTAQGGAGDST